MQEGTIKVYFPPRGFGFITRGEHVADVFFHIRDTPDLCEDDLTPGRAVRFDTRDDPKGARAYNIALLEGVR